MPAPRGKKRKSSASAGEPDAPVDHKIPTKAGSPAANESPMKRRKIGINVYQKQALIDNLQLESGLPVPRPWNPSILAFWLTW
jgi:hypothetical protein